MRLILNNTEQPAMNVPANWGDLLQRLDGDANQRGEVVTAVRFDGVDEPTFRDPRQIAREVHELELIELETATPAGLLDEALMQAALAAGALAAAAGQIGWALRRGERSVANTQLTQLGEGIRSLTWLVGTTATVRGVNFNQMLCDGSVMSVLLADLARQLSSIVEAQQAQDFLTVADLLEYDLQPALYSWQVLFEALRHTPASDVART